MSSISKTTASSSCSSTITSTNSDDEGGLRRGPWTLEEDALLIHYISSHGEGRWNLLAKRSGLKRNGKSCRLRWLNYLKPDVKRGNLSPQEQLLILDLHFKWGNRWSKIAQHLPGRTDNEIKNYWRTRVQKQARHLKIDPNSNQFQELIRCVWMPRLIQKIHAQSSSSFSSTLIDNNNQVLCNSSAAVPVPLQQQQDNHVVLLPYYNPSFPVMDDKDNASRSSPSRMSSSSSSSSFTSAVNSEKMPFQSESYDMETLFTVMGSGCSNDPSSSSDHHHHVLYSEDQNQWLATDEFIYGSLWNMELDDELSQFQERRSQF